MLNVRFEPEGHLYHVENDETAPGVWEVWTSITQVLEGVKLTDYSFLSEEKRKRALRRGSFVHAAIEQIANREFDEATLDRYPSVAGFIRAYMQFCDDKDWQVVDSEKIILIPKLKIAGRLDQTGRFGYRAGSRLSLIDFKTGFAQPPAALQTAAQEEGLGEDVDRYSLELRENGDYDLIPHESKLDRNTFHAAVALYRWRERVGMLEKKEAA